jgi:hypothetical protein
MGQESTWVSCDQPVSRDLEALPPNPLTEIFYQREIFCAVLRYSWIFGDHAFQLRIGDIVHSYCGRGKRAMRYPAQWLADLQNRSIEILGSIKSLFGLKITKSECRVYLQYSFASPKGIALLVVE